MERETYERMVRNSTTGNRQSAKPKRIAKVNVDKLKKTMVTMCAACVIIGALATTGIKTMANKIHENFELYHDIDQFDDTVIKTNTHRTDNGQYYWYDYNKIGESIKTDEDVYKLYHSIGEYQGNKVLQTLDNPTTFDDYIKDHNYKDKDDFLDTNKKRILLENDIEKKQSQLNEMIHDNESQEVQETVELGGK